MVVARSLQERVQGSIRWSQEILATQFWAELSRLTVLCLIHLLQHDSYLYYSILSVSTGLLNLKINEGYISLVLLPRRSMCVTKWAGRRKPAWFLIGLCTPLNLGEVLEQPPCEVRLRFHRSQGHCAIGDCSFDKLLTQNPTLSILLLVLLFQVGVLKDARPLQLRSLYESSTFKHQPNKLQQFRQLRKREEESQKCLNFARPVDQRSVFF